MSPVSSSTTFASIALCIPRMRPEKVTRAHSATIIVPMVTSERRGLRHRLRHAILPTLIASPRRQVAHAEEVGVEMDIEAQLLPGDARVLARAVERPHRHHRRQRAPADGLDLA